MQTYYFCDTISGVLETKESVVSAINNFVQKNPVAIKLTIGSTAVIGVALLAIGLVGHFSHLGSLSQNMAFIPIGLGATLSTAASVSLIYQRTHRAPSKEESVAALSTTKSSFDISSLRPAYFQKHGKYRIEVKYSGENLSVEDYKAILIHCCNTDIIELDIDGVQIQKSAIGKGYFCVVGVPQPSRNLEQAVDEFVLS